MDKMDVDMKASLDDLIKKDKKFLRKKRSNSKGKGQAGPPKAGNNKMPRRIKNRGAGIFKKKNSSTGGPGQGQKVG